MKYSLYIYCRVGDPCTLKEEKKVKRRNTTISTSEEKENEVSHSS